MFSSMQVSRRRVSALLAALAAGGLWGPIARGQEKPAVNTLTLVLGSQAGSTTDYLCRKLAEVLKPGYANNVLVHNRTGASLQVAIIDVKNAAPNGATALVTPSPPIVIFPLTYKKLPYDPNTDLVPVALLGEFEGAYAVGPMVPESVTNMREYYAWCKANPDKAAFGSPAAGSSLHLVGSMAARLAGVDVLHVPYRGPTPAVTEMVGGQISAAISVIGDFQEYVKAGNCRILATTGYERSRFTPDVPTFIEQGFKDFGWVEWYGMFLPAGTSDALVQRLSADLKTILADPGMIAALEEQSIEAKWAGPKEFASIIQTYRTRWAPVVEALEFSVDS
ncbi:MAG: tripartite tricarboxylate transporter substrate-binding protein [Pigmentiphaga sp.]